MQNRIPLIRHRRGAVAVLVAVLLPVLLMFSAFAINVAQMHLVRSELRVAADAAARAASRQYSLTQSVAAAEAAGIEAASRNLVWGKPLGLTPGNGQAYGDIEFGVSTPTSAADIANGRPSWSFKVVREGEGRIDTARVTARRTAGSSSGEVPLLFTPFLQTKRFRPLVTTEAMQIDRDIVLVLDRSASMILAAEPGVDEVLNVPFLDGTESGPTAWMSLTGSQMNDRDMDIGIACISGTKMQALEHSVGVFLDLLEQSIPEEHVGLTTFYAAATPEVELVDTYQAIRDRIAVRTARVTGWGTDIPAGFAAGLVQLLNPNTSRPSAHKTIVLMTDGAGGDPVAKIEAAFRDHEVQTHVVTFGTAASGQLDIPLMQQAAAAGGGRHWHADNGQDLTAAFREIAADVPTVLTY